MSVPTRNVTVTLFEQDGDPIEGATVTAKITSSDLYNDQYVAQVTQTGVTDANGVAILAVFPNELGSRGTRYIFTANHPSTGKRILREVVTVPDTDVALSDLVNEVVTVSDPTEPAPFFSALAALSGTGIVTRTSTYAFAPRTITGTANQVSVLYGDGVSGDPVLSLPQDVHSGASPTFTGLTLSGNATVSGTGTQTIGGSGSTLRLAGSSSMNITSDTGRLTTWGLRFQGTSASTAGIAVMPKSTATAEFRIYNADDVTGTNLGWGRIYCDPSVPSQVTFGAGAAGSGTQPSTFHFSTNVSSDGVVTIKNGATAATAGALRLANTHAIRWRNAADNNNLGMYLDSSDRLVVDVAMYFNRSYGALAAGTVNANYIGAVYSADTGGTTDGRGLTLYSQLTGGYPAAAHTGLLSSTAFAATAGTTTALRGVHSYLSATGSGATVTNSISFSSQHSYTTAQTITNAIGLYTYAVTASGGAAVANVYGVKIDNANITASGFNYGVWVGNQNTATTRTAALATDMAAATNKWALYSSGTASSAHYGSLRLGSTTAPTEVLDVTGNALVSGTIGVGATRANWFSVRAGSTLTGSVGAIGVYSIGTSQSDVTSYHYAFASAPATQNASYTVSNVVGLYCYNVTRGASSTITNQYGIIVADLTEGTNKYGMQLAVSSGANKWNMYASGTANNAFAGNVRIGSTTAPTNALDVTGSATVSGSAAVGAAATVSGYQHYVFRDGVDTGAADVSTYSWLRANNASGSNGKYGGWFIVSPGLTFAGTSALYGVLGQVSVPVTGTFSNTMSAFTSSLVNSSTATLTGSLYSYFANPLTNTGGGTVSGSTVYGFYAADQAVATAAAYSFYSAMASGSGKYAFYANGTANNYFNGTILRGNAADFKGASDNYHINILSRQTAYTASTANPLLYPSADPGAGTYPFDAFGNTVLQLDVVSGGSRDFVIASEISSTVAPRLVLDGSTGYMGLGLNTSMPTYALDVWATASSQGIRYKQTTDSTMGGVTVENNTGASLSFSVARGGASNAGLGLYASSVGHAFLNNVRIGSSTAPTVALDVTGALATSLGAVIGTTLTVSNGGTAASAGAIRLSNNNAFRWRNAANTADLGMYLSTSDNLIFDCRMQFAKSIQIGNTPPIDRLGLYMTGTIDGTAGSPWGMYITPNPSITNVASLTAGHALIGGSAMTVNNGAAMTNLATLWLAEPNIVLTSGTVAASHTLYIAGVATEATTNWGLGVNGQSYFANSLRVGGTAAPTQALDVTGNAVLSGTITTGTAGGSSGAWKLGVANAVSPTSPNRTLTVDIGGTTYYIHAKTTND